MTLKNRLSVTTLLALISLSSGALAQPVLATTKPTYGHLRANHGVTIYPRLPINRQQLRRGHFTRRLTATTFKISRQQRGIGGDYLQIIIGHYGGWIAANTVIPATIHSTTRPLKITRNHVAKPALISSTNSATWPHLTNRKLQLAIKHRFSSQQIKQLHLRIGKIVWTTHEHYFQIIGNHGFHARLPITNRQSQLTTAKSRPKQRLTKARFQSKSGQRQALTKNVKAPTLAKLNTTTKSQTMTTTNVKSRYIDKNTAVSAPRHTSVIKTTPAKLAPTNIPNAQQTQVHGDTQPIRVPQSTSPATMVRSNQKFTATVSSATPAIKPTNTTATTNTQQPIHDNHVASPVPLATPADHVSHTVTIVTATSQVPTKSNIGVTKPSQVVRRIPPTSNVPVNQDDQQHSNATINASTQTSASAININTKDSVSAASPATVPPASSHPQGMRYPSNASTAQTTTQTAGATNAQLSSSAATSSRPHSTGTSANNQASATPAPKYTAQQALQAINQLMTTNHFMGTLLVTNNGPAGVKTLTFGSADLNQRIANTADESYPLASLEKSVTGAVIQRLINEGKLTMNTTLDHFYPQVPYAQSITIRQLLDHTSGIQMGEPVPAQALTDDQQAVAFTLNHLTSTNQHHWSYSNANFTLLAGIVDQLTGQSFSANVQADILKPLNLQHTFVYNQVPATAVHPLPYTFSNGASVPRSISTNLLSSELGCGNLYASVGDFYTFIHNLVDGQLVTPTGFQELANKLQPTYSGGIYYRNDGTIRIGGADNNLYSLYVGSNNSKITMIFFANQAKWATMNTIGGQIEQILTQAATL